MSRNGSGTFNLVSGNPVVTGTTISSTTMNSTLSDIATALTASIANDGQTPITANLPMSTYRHTGVGAASARTDYARAGEVQDSTYTWLTSVTGTDTITASIVTPTLAAYATGQSFRFVSAGANTTSVTLNINSIGAKAVTKNGTTALVAGDIPSGAVCHVVYDGTQFQLVGVRAGGAITSSAFTMSTARLLGRTTASTGAVEEITVGTGLSLSAGSLTATSIAYSIPVRQTVLGGPVDSSGLPNFGGSTGSTTVTASGTLTATCALGVAATGTADYVGQITNPSWTGLSTNGTMYLYLDITSGGVVTTGSSTLAPTYQWGGTYSTTNGQHTFNIQEMTMKVGNGSVTTQVYRVFVGEVTVSGNVTTAITWYALMGRYDSGRFAVATNTSYTKSHNIGIRPSLIRYYGASTNGGDLSEFENIYTAGWYGAWIDTIKPLSFRLSTGDTNVYLKTAPGTQTAAVEAQVFATRGW